MKIPVYTGTALQFNADSRVCQHRFSPVEMFVTAPRSAWRRLLVLGCVGLPLALSPFAHSQRADFGTVSIASTSAATAVNITFTTPATLGSVSVVTQGASGLDFANSGAGTCATGTAYDVGDTCTVNVTFTPALAGTRYGAVVLEDGSADVVGNTYLQGTGAGPQLTYLPGAESTLSANVISPGTVAVDGSGNVYIVDCNNNRVLKETLLAGVYTESVVPTGVLNIPYSVVLDGAGNLYIADSTNNRVLKETLSAGNYTESIVPSSALNYPTDIAVDGRGNIYIADEGNNRVLVETMTSGGYVETAVTTSALNQPGAIAVDASGNIYIADAGNNRVLVETPAADTYTESTLATSALNYPGAVRVDGSGNIYIADTFNQRVLKETFEAGTYAESVVATSALNYPYGLAVDGNGNIYVSDAFNNRVLKEDLADAPSLGFAATNLGSTSSDSPRTVTVSNYGNSALQFLAISYPADFPENSPAPGDCTSTIPLNSGASCTLTVNFSPVSSLNGNLSAPLTEAVSVTTNATPTPQTIGTTGTETQP
jgi:sugar lactone lactonase YvrE